MGEVALTDPDSNPPLPLPLTLTLTITLTLTRWPARSQPADTHAGNQAAIARAG